MLKIDPEPKLDFDDVLLVPQRSRAASRKEVDLKRRFRFYHSPKEWHGVPLVAANMDTTGTFKMGTALNSHEMVTCLHKHYDADVIDNFYKYYNVEHNVWISIGMDLEKELQRLFYIEDNTSVQPNICIDIANGYTERFVDYCGKIRLEFPNSIIMAGNVCTPEMVSELILHGEVDIVKIGIGPGSACTTRLKTGVGYPQLSAIAECAHAAHGLRSDTGRLGLICADGGCRTAGDVAKAYAAGADFVMLGGMLAGTDECEGEWEYTTISKSSGKEFPNGPELDSPMNNWKKKKKSLLFYGMSSEEAQNKHNDGMNDYATSEGRVKTVPYKGKVDGVVRDIFGGVRSACAYTGATCLKDFSKTARFVRVNRTHNDQSV
jgi:GMP reductase